MLGEAGEDLCVNGSESYAVVVSGGFGVLLVLGLVVVDGQDSPCHPDGVGQDVVFDHRGGVVDCGVEDVLGFVHRESPVWC